MDIPVIRLLQPLFGQCGANNYAHKSTCPQKENVAKIFIHNQFDAKAALELQAS
jgi:hypothetical protein